MNQFIDFIKNAKHDGSTLVAKILGIIALFGGLRKEEQCYICWGDLTRLEDDTIRVFIKERKNCKNFEYIIPNTPTYDVKLLNGSTVQKGFADIVWDYKEISCSSPNQRILVYPNAKQGGFTRKVYGINQMCKLLHIVIAWLNINTDGYTTHMWRRMMGTILAESGANNQTIRLAGNWSSDSVAQRYIHNSLNNKRKIAKALSHGSMIEAESNNTAYKPTRGMKQ